MTMFGMGVFWTIRERNEVEIWTNSKQNNIGSNLKEGLSNSALSLRAKIPSRNRKVWGKLTNKKSFKDLDFPGDPGSKLSEKINRLGVQIGKSS